MKGATLQSLQEEWLDVLDQILSQLTSVHHTGVQFRSIEIRLGSRQSQTH